MKMKILLFVLITSILLISIIISGFDYSKAKDLREERDEGRQEILKMYNEGKITQEEAVKMMKDWSEYIALKSGVKIIRKKP